MKNACSHTEAVARVFLQIDGFGIQPVCAPPPPPVPVPTPTPTPNSDADRPASDDFVRPSNRC